MRRACIVGGGLLLVAVVAGCSDSERRFTSQYASTSQTDTSTAASNELEEMSLEEIMKIDFSAGRGTISLDKVGSGDSYLLVVSAANTTSGNYTIQLADLSLPSSLLASNSLALNSSTSSEDPEEAEFHRFLGEIAASLPNSDETIVPQPSLVSSLAKSPSIGDKKSFNVLSSMSSIARCKTVMGELRAITSNLLVYVDKEASDSIEDEEVEELALNFDRNSIPLERSLFGNESDLNNDGYITILMSGITNGMASSGGIVTGFFFPGDLYSKSASNPCSNEQEIFYTLVPDPRGEFGIPITAEFATQNILPGVLCHEYQHMISFNRHALLGEGRTEEPWLNEAISHLTEDLCGYGLENYSRVKLFLDRPSTTSLVPTTSPSLAERGAGYLFLRYLYEQHPKGETFMRRLLEGNSNGSENIVGSFEDGEFADLLNRWSLTLALSELGPTSDPKYNYQTPFKHPVTGNRSGICLRCDAEDGRGTVLKGPAMAKVDSFPIVVNLNATASQILIVSDPPFSLGIIGAGGPNLTGTMLRLAR